MLLLHIFFFYSQFIWIICYWVLCNFTIYCFLWITKKTNAYFCVIIVNCTLDYFNCHRLVVSFSTLNLKMHSQRINAIWWNWQCLSKSKSYYILTSLLCFYFSNRAGCYDNNQNGLIINNNFQCSIINRRCQLFGCYRFSHILSLSAVTYGHFNCDVFNDACDLYAMIQYCTTYFSYKKKTLFTVNLIPMNLVPKFH